MIPTPDAATGDRPTSARICPSRTSQNAGQGASARQSAFFSDAAIAIASEALATGTQFHRQGHAELLLKNGPLTI